MQDHLKRKPNMVPNGIPSDLLLTVVSGGSASLRDHGDPNRSRECFLFYLLCYILVIKMEEAI